MPPPCPAPPRLFWPFPPGICCSLLHSWTPTKTCKLLVIKPGQVVNCSEDLMWGNSADTQQAYGWALFRATDSRPWEAVEFSTVVLLPRERGWDTAGHCVLRRTSGFTFNSLLTCHNYSVSLMHTCFADLQSTAPGQPQGSSPTLLLKVSFPALPSVPSLRKI